MTDRAPKGYERVEDGAEKEIVTFWAELWRPMPPVPEMGYKGNAHGESLISPRFGTEPECVTWIKARRREFHQVGMWKRVSRGPAYEDIPLNTAEAPLPDKARLHTLVDDLKKMLDDKKRDLDKGRPKSKPYTRVGEFNPIGRPFTYEELYEQESSEPTGSPRP